MNKSIFLKNSATFHRRPFFILAIFFSLGIIVESFLNLPFFPFFLIGCFLIVLSLCFTKNDLYFGILLLLFFFLLGMLGYKNYNFLPKTHLYYRLPAKKTHTFCIGTISEDPQIKKSHFSPSLISFKLNAEFLKLGNEWIAVEGKLLVSIYQSNQVFNCADRLLIEGDILKPQPPTNPYQFNYRKFLEQDKIFALLRTDKNGLVKKIGTAKPNFIKKYAFLLRRRFKSKIAKYVSWPHSEVLKGVLLGIKEEIPKETEELFTRTGTMHLLAISGLHVGLVVAGILFLLRVCFVSGKMRFFLVVLFLFFYVPFTGSRIPVTRASIMLGIILIGFLFDRETDILNSLGIAAGTILLFFPNEIFSIGFQLSFICLLSIIYFSPKIESLFDFEMLLPNKLRFYLKKSLSVSLAAWLGTLPLIIYYFNNISFLTVIANLAAIPLLFLIIVFAFIFLLSGRGFLSELLADLTSHAIGFLLKILALLSSLPFAFYKTAAWTAMGMVCFYILLFFIFNLRRFKIRIFYVWSAVLLALNFCIWLPLFNEEAAAMKINFFDVGFADAILLEFPKDRYVLIDAGSFAGDCGRRIVAPYLWNKNIKRLDAVILTHPDSDHLGGLNFILENFEIGAVFDNGQEGKSALFAEYADILERHKIEHFKLSEKQCIYGFENLKIAILHPPAGAIEDAAGNLNDNSIVLKVDYGSFSILLPGDVQAEGLERLIAYGENLQTDIIKMPHHGLEASAGIEILLDFVRPEVAVISAGDSSREDKIQKTKQILAERGVRVYNTAEEGFISVETDGFSYKIKSFKQRAEAKN